MKRERWKITYKFVFMIMLSVLLISRIQVLTDNYTWPLDPVLLEMVYLAGTAVLCLLAQGGKYRILRGKYLLVMTILLIHTVLWGTVFVDDRFTDLINSQFKSQIMFVTILWVNVLAVYQLDAGRDFLRCCYYTLSVMLIYYFLTNLSELDLSNLANIMTVSDRSRANFGFGHYNALGGTCVCCILMRETVKKEHHSIATKTVDAVILVVAVCMLLACASRSALTSLVVYYFVYYSWQMDEWAISPKAIRAIKVGRNLLIVAMVLWVVLEANYTELLNLSQRSLLFTHALPMFFDTGKIWLGLGYASNMAYATQQTPYLTYWLDNAYIYYLITTGIVGCALLMIALLILGRELYKRVGQPFGKEVFAAFAVYLYASLFEATLFHSGGFVNYIYLPWFLIYISRKRKTETS